MLLCVVSFAAASPQAQKLQSNNDVLLRQVESLTLEKAEMLGQIQVGLVCQVHVPARTRACVCVWGGGGGGRHRLEWRGSESLTLDKAEMLGQIQVGLVGLYTWSHFLPLLEAHQPWILVGLYRSTSIACMSGACIH